MRFRLRPKLRRFVVAVSVVRLNQTNRPGGQNSDDEGDRQDATVVAVELNFRQDIDQSDADKDAGAQAEGPAKDQGLRLAESLNSEVARDGSDGTEQCVGEVDSHTAQSGEACGSHQ